MMESVVAIAVERLSDLLIEEGRILSGVRQEVEQLKAELLRMQCFLKDADSRVHNGDHSVRNWVSEIRDLALEAESIIEVFVVKVASKNRGIKRLFTIFSEAIIRHKLATEIRNIQTTIASITRSLQTYGIKGISEIESSNSKQRWLRQSYPHLAEEDFVGMEEDMSNIISYLIDDRKRYKVVSLYGMGGLGKTTLAKKIFNHVDVRRHFERFAWVCITQQCQAKSILQDVLRELVPEKGREAIVSMGDRELVQEIYKVQQERKCLVVLDDIWTMEAWNSLNLAFPIKEAAGHSKVLLTTRIERVAKEGYPHNLRYLNKEEGWELLQKKAFPIVKYGTESKVDKEIEKIGRVMVQKCGGLPLAISVLGGLLKDKGTSGDWDMVNRDIVTYLKRGGENIEEKQGAIEQVLALSYYNLPYRLKPCFLYLSHFLKAESIKVEQLCLLWIAEGMISSEDQSKGETLMEVAECYLGELAQRSMVQVISLVDPSMRSTTNRYGSCQIHDLMHDLCLSMGKEEDFFHVLDFRSRGNTDSSVHLNLTSSITDTKARRFALYVHDEYLGSDIHSFRSRRIRSMLIHSTRLHGYGGRT